MTESDTLIKFGRLDGSIWCFCNRCSFSAKSYLYYGSHDFKHEKPAPEDKNDRQT